MMLRYVLGLREAMGMPIAVTTTAGTSVMAYCVLEMSERPMRTQEI